MPQHRGPRGWSAVQGAQLALRTSPFRWMAISMTGGNVSARSASSPLVQMMLIA